MPACYDRTQIAAWLDPHTVAKARDDAHAVSDLCWIADDTLSGLVQGTGRRPYHVEVTFYDIDDDM